jgi:hypothetical protein
MLLQTSTPFLQNLHACMDVVNTVGKLSSQDADRRRRAPCTGIGLMFVDKFVIVIVIVIDSYQWLSSFCDEFANEHG